jgi:hypothetical protein
VREVFKDRHPDRAVPELIYGWTSVTCGEFAAKTEKPEVVAEMLRKDEEQKGEERGVRKLQPNREEPEHDVGSRGKSNKVL